MEAEWCVRDVYKSLYEVRSLIVCSDICLADTNSISVTYISESRICQLSNSVTLTDCQLSTTGKGTVTGLVHARKFTRIILFLLHNFLF